MRTDVDRRSLLRGIGAAGVAGLAGCAGGPTGGSGNGSENGSGNGGSGPSAHIGMVYALGGLGDQSFNDSAHRGIQRAKRELGVAFNNAEPETQDQFSQYQRRYASSRNPQYDLVACIGYSQQSALDQSAQNFPDQNFLLVDGVVDRDNVANYQFKEHEGSFQMGHLGGLLTGRSLSAGAGSTNPSQKRIGFVGGEDVPLIRKFEAGYRAGAKHADGDVRVSSSYIGSYNDASSAKATARSMYEDGVDIVYHAAGAAGVGVFQAASETGNFAFGVDSDQSKTQSSGQSEGESGYADVILASMVKGVDQAVFESARNAVNGQFRGGSTVELGLKNEGVACVYGAQIGSAIPDEVKSALQESRRKIIDGEISVPQSPQ